MKWFALVGYLTKYRQPDEIMSDLNHGDIYNTQNSQQTYTLESIFE